MRAFTGKIKYAIGSPDKLDETMREGPASIIRYTPGAEIEAAIFRADFGFRWCNAKDNRCYGSRDSNRTQVIH